MKLSRCAGLVLVPCLLLAASLGCGSGDPRQKVLKERARWEVQLLSWIQSDDGIDVSTRISGPISTKLSHLTVRFQFLDAEGEALGEAWHSYDLSSVPRGLAQDFDIRLPPVEQTVEGLGISPVLNPRPEEEPFIRELRLDSPA